MGALGRFLETDMAAALWTAGVLGLVGLLLATLTPVVAIATAMNILGRLLGRWR